MTGTAPDFGAADCLAAGAAFPRVADRRPAAAFRAPLRPVAFVSFANGKPTGTPREILTGFLSPDEKDSYGRPVGVVIAKDGAVLMADDVGDVIWRVTGA